MSIRRLIRCWQQRREIIARLRGGKWKGSAIITRLRVGKWKGSAMGRRERLNNKRITCLRQRIRKRRSLKRIEQLKKKLSGLLG
jgi:hypothetical protein